MNTKPEGFWWFRSGSFDREAFETDLRESLPSFYADRGYIDFAVLGDTLVVDPRTGAARLVVDVREGPQYRLGEFIIQGASHFPHEELERISWSSTARCWGSRWAAPASAWPARCSTRARWTRGQADPAALPQPGVPVRAGGAQRGAPPRGDRAAAEGERHHRGERAPALLRAPHLVRGELHHARAGDARPALAAAGRCYDEGRLIQSFQALCGLGFFETPMPTPSINPDLDSGAWTSCST